MKVLAFQSQKGGSGKTTLAVHTAVAAMQGGEHVIIIDTDPQKSAKSWGEARGDAEPHIAAVTPASVDDVLKAARDEGITLVVIDTAPHAAPEAARVARLADLVAIPVRPSAFDLAATEATVRIVRAAGVRAAIIQSACPFRAPEIVDARTLLEPHGYPIAPMVITDRRAFARAVATGQAVTEFEEDGKAAEEIRDLWNWLRKEMEHGAQADGARSVHGPEDGAARGARASPRRTA